MTAEVLVVDDDPDVRNLMALALSTTGFSVVRAAGGREALAELDARRFDLVLLDIQMPSCDGWAVLEAIRGNVSTADLPVIVATVKGRSVDMQRAWRLGCDGYVTKPFSMVELRQEAERVTSRSPDEREAIRRARGVESP